MNPRSLKFRLIAWYAGWLTVLFVVFGFFVYNSLERHLKNSLRESLTRRARLLADQIERRGAESESLRTNIQNRFAPEANNRFIRVTVNDEVRYVSDWPADQSFDPGLVPLAPRSRSAESFGSRTMPNGLPLLIAVWSGQKAGQRLVIEEGASEAPIYETLRAWLVGLVGGLALLISGAVMGGFLLAKQALDPVNQIIASAARITSRNLAERLPVPDTGDEIERMSLSLNEMIRRLDDAFQHTRRFLVDASHELRTPLTMLRAEIETVIEKSTGNPEIADLARSAQEEVVRLQNIVEALFALSRLEAGEALQQSKPFDFAELSATTAEQMCLLAEDKNIEITCQPPKGVVVEGDKARLKQVVVNLLDNAIKYTPEGGQIAVRVRAEDGNAVLEVTDNGIGIPKESVSRVFDRFYRVDQARARQLGGAGLGLPIVKSICLAHGGSVHLESTEGGGTRVTVLIPLATKQSASGDSPSAENHR